MPRRLRHAGARPRSRRKCSRLENQLPMAGARPPRTTGEQVADRLDEPDHEPERGPATAGGRSEYDVNSTRTRARASANSSGRSAVRAIVGRLAVRRTRVGRDEHARAREPGAPAEVEVLGTGERRGVESAELLEEVGAHEHGRGRDVEDVAHAVVLLLVELARFDAGVRRTEAVDGAPDFQQDLRVVGADQLRSEDARRSTGRPPPPAVRTADGSSTTSSWQRRRKVAPSTACSASLAAAAKPALSSRRRTNARGSTAATRGVGSSSEPQSTTSTVRSS